MERTQSRDWDASTWADEHRNKVRGHDGRHGRRDIPYKESTRSSRKSARRPGNKRDRSSPTGSRRQSRSRSRSRSPHHERTNTSGGGITGTLSGLFTSAQEAIGASWAATTAQNTVRPDPVPVLRHPRVPKTEAARELSRSQDDSSDESAAESSRRERALGARRRTMGLVCLCTSYMRTQDTLPKVKLAQKAHVECVSMIQCE